MRNFIVLCGLFLFTLPLLSQKADLPKKIVVTFDQKFPGVTEVKWKKDKSDYKIKFDYKGKKTVAEINEEGKWKKTSVNFTLEELPQGVQSTIKANRKNGEVNSIKQITEEGKATVYKVEIKDGNTLTKLKIDEAGKVLKSESETKSDKK